MNAKEALAKIKAAEQKTEQDVQQSNSQAGEIMQAAQRESDRLLNTARNKAKTDGEKFQVQNEKELYDEIMRLEKETAMEIRKIREKAALAGDKPLALVISKLKK